MADKTYTLTVQVVDSAGAGRPIAQAQVPVSCGDKRRTKHTDGNGRAVFLDLPGETYSVEAAAFGQHTGPKGDTVEAEQRLQPPLSLPVGFQLAVGRPDGETAEPRRGHGRQRAGGVPELEKAQDRPRQLRRRR